MPDRTDALRRWHDQLGAMIDQVGLPDYSLREMVDGLRGIRDEMMAAQSASVGSAIAQANCILNSDMECDKLRECREALESSRSERRAIPPLDPTKDMIEAGAQRLVSWEDGCKWPDSWDRLHVHAARNEAERVWRSMWLQAMGEGE